MLKLEEPTPGGQRQLVNEKILLEICSASFEMCFVSALRLSFSRSNESSQESNAAYVLHKNTKKKYLGSVNVHSMVTSLKSL